MIEAARWRRQLKQRSELKTIGGKDKLTRAIRHENKVPIIWERGLGFITLDGLGITADTSPRPLYKTGSSQNDR
jgi:hypothetical protein